MHSCKCELMAMGNNMISKINLHCSKCFCGTNSDIYLHRYCYSCGSVRSSRCRVMNIRHLQSEQEYCWFVSRSIFSTSRRTMTTKLKNICFNINRLIVPRHILSPKKFHDYLCRVSEKEKDVDGFGSNFVTV